MTDEHTMKLTDFDYLTGDRHLQMVKAALPYVSVSHQRILSFLVKFWELRNTMALFQEEPVAAMGISVLPEEQKSSPLDMIKAMQPYGDPQEQDFIQRICNFIQGVHTGNQYPEVMTSQVPFSGGFRSDGFTTGTVSNGAIPSDNLPAGTVSNGTIPSEEGNGDTVLSDSEPYSPPQSGSIPSALQQLKGFLPPDQQARFEQAKFLMQTLQQLS